MENQQITISHALMSELSKNKAVVINCNQQHLPVGILMPLAGHSEQTERYRVQLNASVPLKKNLWQQTIVSKLRNQAKVLEFCDQNAKLLKALATKVLSGDSTNLEAQGASYYWRNLFGNREFTRTYDAAGVNNWLNYGYAIVRAAVARSLVSTGLMTSVGIHHKNKYNAHCLADDIMEPYRPYVDLMVVNLWDKYPDLEALTPEIRQELLRILQYDVLIGGKTRPFMLAVDETTSTLYKCFKGEQRKISYPVL